MRERFRSRRRTFFRPDEWAAPAVESARERDAAIDSMTAADMGPGASPAAGSPLTTDESTVEADTP